MRLSAGLGLLICPLSRASSAPVVSGIVFTPQDGWNYYPAVQSGMVVGFLAEQVAGPIPPNAFTILWFKKSSDSTFAADGIHAVSVAAAANQIAVDLADPDLFSHAAIADLVSSPPSPAGIVEAVPMANGLSLADPLQAVVDLLDAPTMEFVVSIGAEGAASISAATIDENACGTASKMDDILNTFASSAEAMISSGGAVTSGSIAAVFGCCWPRSYTSYMEVPTGAWVSMNPMGPTCTYTRPTSRIETTCSISLFCVTSCATTGTAVDSQDGTCTVPAWASCPPPGQSGCIP